jgi:hypothetical protein
MRLAQLIACGAAALCVAISAMAQSPGQPSGTSPSATSGSTAATASKSKGMKVKQGQTRKQTFDQLDTNHDGSVSRSEAEASPVLILIFTDTDTNGDGQVSPAEFVLVPLEQPDGTLVQ